MPERPNILLITSDQHRYDSVRFMGNTEIRTPNLDNLASQGVVFERTYVTNPVCMPSRATFLTGQFPDAHGVRSNGVEVPDQPWGLARVLREHGWRTGMFGKTHFCPLRRDYDTRFRFHNWREGDDYYGFEERAITHDLKDFVSDIPTAYHDADFIHDPTRAYDLDDYVDWIRQAHPDQYKLAVREGLPEGERPAAPELWTSQLPVELHQSTWIVDRTMDFISHHHDEPFFAWCSFVDPHHPFNAPAPYREKYDPEALANPVWRDGELQRRSRYHQQRHRGSLRVWDQHWREYRAQYYGMIDLIDEQIGRIVRCLEDAGVADNTLVIFTSDHGEMLGDHGLNRKGLFHYEQLLRVPMLLRFPGTVRAGLRQSGIAQNVDVPATILDIAGVALPHQYQGIPLTAWCNGQRDDSPRPYALVTNGGEGPHYDPWPELRTLVTERYKLQYYVNEGHVEIDDLRDDPCELNPLPPERHDSLLRDLMAHLVDASSAASVWGEHTGRW